MRRFGGWQSSVSTVTIGISFGSVLLVGPMAAASSSAAMRDAIRQTLPRYDPKIRADHLAAPPMKTPLSEPTTEGLSVEPGEPLVSLPRIIVRSTQEETPAVTLPRIIVRPPVNNVKIDEMLTPAARDAQLVKKHLSSFDRNFLNRFTLPFFGRSKESRAQHAEAIEATASQLNAIADLIEREGGEDADPEEQKKLKKLYLETYISRPK
jgi:hypothetical protein